MSPVVERSKRSATEPLIVLAIVAAAVAVEEERFTCIKLGKRPIPFSTRELPFHAIDYCLREAGIRLVKVHRVAYWFDPSLLLGRHMGGETIGLPLDDRICE